MHLPHPTQAELLKVLQHPQGHSDHAIASAHKALKALRRLDTPPAIAKPAHTHPRRAILGAIKQRCPKTSPHT